MINLTLVNISININDVNSMTRSEYLISINHNKLADFCLKLYRESRTFFFPSLSLNSK